MKHYHAHETLRMQELHGVELASFLSRAIALAIDMVACTILFLLIVGPAIRLLEAVGMLHLEKDITLTFFKNWYSVVWYVLYFSISCYLGNGKTIGKWICKIRVVSLVHHKMNLWHSTERALGYGASVLEAGFGFIQYFIHPNCRTVHDRIAETIVVTERRKNS
ncbi:MAG: RDD family protein [Bacteroidetes bacterium]|nr:MAG: RDD family protein [Bacteroidota bacterium]